jgi:hypothetical protein
LVLTAITVAAPALPAAAEEETRAGGKLSLFGDVRLRLERDWDSMQSDGVEREDRDRMRARLRFGFTYHWSEVVSFGGRIRTGSRESQQSPHVTLGSDFEPEEINVDKVFIQVASGALWGWGGKNSFPFWKQNELFWDDDVTPEGVAGGYGTEAGPGRFEARAGAFVLDEPDAGDEFSESAHLLAGQALFSARHEETELTVAAGLFDFDDNPEYANEALRDLDHLILTVSFQAALRAGGRPLLVGADFMENLENFPADVVNRGETTGYVLSVSSGSTAEKGDWLVAYHYAHIEEFAVVPLYAQDDWLRWGSATDTRSSNFKGHELRGAYAVGKGLDLVARLYLVEGIALRDPSAVAREDGKRLRLDLNIGF